MNGQSKFLVAAIVTTSLWAALSPVRATLVLQLDSANYAPGTWTSSLPGGTNAVQGTVASQPAWIANATPRHQPALQFDGTDDSLNLSTALSSAAFLGSPSMTIFMVAKPVTVGYLEQRDLFGGADGSVDFRLQNYGTANQLIFERRHQNGIAGAGPASADWNIYTVTYDGTTARLYTNGVLLATSAVSDTFNNPITAIGGAGSSFFNGEIAAVYVYDSVLNAPTLASVNAQLFSDYLVPEPSTVLLLALGGWLVLHRRSPSLGGQGRHRT